MKVYFWGTRGSLNASLNEKMVRRKITQTLKTALIKGLPQSDNLDAWIDSNLAFATRSSYGANTPCVEIAYKEDEYILCDAGTGIRDFAVKFANSPASNKPATFHLFISHLHWDHIQGFPFFFPIYDPKNTIIIHGYHEQIEWAFNEQMREPFFPVDFKSLPSTVIFNVKKPCEPFEIGDMKITGAEQNHPGKSYGYRFEQAGKTVIYSTDCEHKEFANKSEYPLVEFYNEADLLIGDAQYSLVDATYYKEDWGHSSNVMAIELAARAKVKHLVLFHMEPTSSDETLDDFFADTMRYCQLYENEFEKKQTPFPEQITMAYDGLEIIL